MAALVFLVGLAIGVAPREIGRRVDPYDPYNEQFTPVLQPEVLLEHARILGMECLPRLIAGYTLPEFEATPEGLTPNGRPLPRRPGRMSSHPHAIFATLFSMGLFVLSIAWMAKASKGMRNEGRVVSAGLLLSSGLIVLAFLVNRNIFNSDNYRYLIFLLAPWSLGFGLMMRSLGQRATYGGILAVAISLILAGSMTASLAAWYQGLDWIDEGRRATTASQPLGSVPSFVSPFTTHIYGDYWDVYRLIFLSGRHVDGVPFPTYPNRFPGWSQNLGPGQGELFVLDPSPGWQAMLAESWRREGRDPAELNQLTIRFP